jgi:hypothetical protein
MLEANMMDDKKNDDHREGINTDCGGVMTEQGTPQLIGCSKFIRFKVALEVA